MPSGIRRLGRKRFAEAIRYLKIVISDESRADRLRMQAVESLLAIYDRNDRTLAQYAQKERAAKSSEPVQSASQPIGVSQEPDQQEESLDSFLARIKAARENRNNGQKEISEGERDEY